VATMSSSDGGQRAAFNFDSEEDRNERE